MVKRIFLIGLLALGACFNSAPAQDANSGNGEKPKQEFSPEYQQAYEKAIQAFNKNDFDDALKQLEEADKAQAGVAATLNLRGAVYVRQKKYDEAQKVFADLYKKDPENVMAVFNLGETYFLQKNYAEAVKYFQDFTEKSKTQNSLGTYKVFLCNLLTGKEGEAKQALDATQANPTDPLYYYLNVAYLFKQGKENEARGYLASAFQIYPGQANAAFIDSLIELGYVKPEDLKASGGGQAPVGQTPSSSPSSAPAESAPTNATTPDFSGLENLLPSLDADKNKKK
jgi:tetratricopeptide (TPR) repeat protein